GKTNATDLRREMVLHQMWCMGGACGDVFRRQRLHRQSRTCRRATEFRALRRRRPRGHRARTLCCGAGIARGGVRGAGETATAAWALIRFCWTAKTVDATE